jgi:hypothetical protein
MASNEHSPIPHRRVMAMSTREETAMRVIAATFAPAAGLDSIDHMNQTDMLQLQILTDRMSKGDSANSNPLQSPASAGGDRQRTLGFMDYTDDACMHQAMAIYYNGHAGLGANLLRSPDIDASKNEVSIETLQFLPEPDDEVLATFEQGDARHPFVVGSLWNSGSAPTGVIESIGTKYTMFLPTGT